MQSSLLHNHFNMSKKHQSKEGCHRRQNKSTQGPIKTTKYDIVENSKIYIPVLLEECH